MFTQLHKVRGRGLRRSRLGSLFALGAALFFVLAFFASAHGVHAQSIADPNSELQRGITGIQQPLGLANVDIRIIVARIIRIALGLLGLVLLCIILYAGYLWMTAGGNEEKIITSKRMMVNAAIGLAIILAAFSIVSFILRLLGVGSGAGGAGIGTPNVTNFQGSGALGQIIKDHYPSRNQKDVPRNTKIMITFRVPILLDSFVNNTNGTTDVNGNPILGDCINIGPTMNWKTDCDSLKNSDNTHILITRGDTGQPIDGANLLASYENGKVTTIVIRPYDALGSDSALVPYKVRIGKDIRLDDPANNNPSAFQKNGLGNDYYEWQFTCSTELDTAPPRVNNVFPLEGSTEVKNSVIQIDFSEAMDPIGLQGRFATSSGYYVIGNNVLALKSGGSSLPPGEFVLTNGYRTLEFTPSQLCGQNACGGGLYCMPVCDVPNNNCATNARGNRFDAYEVLVKAAQTFNNTSFEAVPFSGVSDASGNALDSEPIGRVNTATTTLPIFPNWEKPDNYFWKFNLIDELDLTSPILNQISPGLDGTHISADMPWQMLWSKRMRIDPLYSITIAEHPTPQQRGDNIPICRVPRIFFNVNGSTYSRMDHCPFLDGRRQYYFPTVPSAVEDAHFNCFYPGVGPGDEGGKGSNYWSTQGSQHLDESFVCDAAHPQNCCAVSSTPQSRALCCNGLVDQNAASTTAACQAALTADSP